MNSFLKKLSVACKSTIHHKAYQKMNEANKEINKVLNKFK
ncbi:hypothetical protein ABEX81_21560 [Bacillus atrophaeus]